MDRISFESSRFLCLLDDPAEFQASPLRLHLVRLARVFEDSRHPRKWMTSDAIYNELGMLGVASPRGGSPLVCIRLRPGARCLGSLVA